MAACLGIDIGIRNLSYCILQKDMAGRFQIIEWQLVDVLQVCGQSERSCDTLTSAEIHDLARFALPLIFPTDRLKQHNIAHVLIEQQPHGKYGNQKIILFSHLIFEYFRSQLLDQRIGDTLETVVFTGAAKKYDSQWLHRYNLSRPTNYAQRKQTSVQLCDIFCTELQLTHLPANNTKKDDLADAFLLAYIGWQHW